MPTKKIIGILKKTQVLSNGITPCKIKARGADNKVMKINLIKCLVCKLPQTRTA